MKKRLLLIALVIVLSTGTVVQSEIHAEAAATVTAVGVAKAVLVLLAIAGVGITMGSIFDQGDIDESAVVKFTTWLNNHDPEFYTEFMVAATAITAGRMVNTFVPGFMLKLKRNAAEYFGTSTSVETEVGTTSFNIRTLSFTPNGSQYLQSNSMKYYLYPQSGQEATSYIPCSFVGSNGKTYAFFIPSYESMFATVLSSFGILRSGGNNVEGLTAYGKSNLWTRCWDYDFSSLAFYKTSIASTNPNTVVQQTMNQLYSGALSEVDESVLMKPFVTVGDVAATSADATVVGAGQTITEDENGEIVIDGDTTINLANVNIDEWLKALAEGTATYAQAMQAIGIAAVNTQTQTLEEVQAIAEALNPAAAGTGSITGNYTVALSDLFPFCIPFDLYNIISCFKADPVAPSAEITIPVGYDGSEFTWETYTVSLSAFDPVAAVVRVLEYVAFIIGLMLVTRKLIEG